MEIRVRTKSSYIKWPIELDNAKKLFNFNDKLALRMKKYFNTTKQHCKQRGIKWDLTFETLCRIWYESGKIDKIGVGKGKYCLCRKEDTGGYEKNNVFIDLVEENCKKGARAHKGGIIYIDGTKPIEGQLPNVIENINEYIGNTIKTLLKLQKQLKNHKQW